MGTLNVIVEQKRCKCARASESGGKQGWQSREGVKADWEKQRRPQPGVGVGRWVGEGREEERGTSAAGGASVGGHLTWSRHCLSFPRHLAHSSGHCPFLPQL